MTTTSAIAVETKRRTCLLVAPPLVDLGIIRRLLRNRGVEPLVFSDVPPVGVTVLDQLSKALAQADVVIFVLAAPKADANVSFEIGLALGQGKKLMVLAPDDVVDVPADMRELLVVKAHLDDDEAIGFSLDQLLAAPPSPVASATPVKSGIGGRPLGDTADALIRRAESLKMRVTRQPADADAQQELKQIMTAALQASHIAPVVASREPDKQADLAAWVDELDSLGLNPLLIELKPRLDTAEAVEAAVEQAHTYLQGFRAQAVLIVYAAGLRVDEVAPFSSHQVVLFGLVDLLHRMRARSFGGVLRAAIYNGAAPNES